MPFDIEGARKAGYSDQEIADHLSGGKFDTEGARKAGYSDSDIIGHLSAAQPEAPQEEPGISLPLIGRPSLVGMVKGLLEAGKSAATLPGDVYAGKVDPLSDEGIKRSMDIAGFVAPSRIPSVATRGATAAPLTSGKLKDVAGESYDSFQGNARNVPVEAAATVPKPDPMAPMTGAAPKAPPAPPVGGDITAFAKDLADYTAKNAPSEMRAPAVFGQIDNVGRAKNVNQLIEIRRNLRDELGGSESKAAEVAMKRLDFEIERRAPGTIQPLKEADKNYAIAMRAKEMEQKIADAQLKAETTGTEGTHIRNAFRNEMTNGGDRFMSPAVQEAMSGVVSPGAGTRALRAASLFDPMRHPWITAATGAATLGKSFLAAPAGIAATKGYNSILRRRANDAVRAILEEAPANAALNPGYQARGRIGMQPQGGYLTQPGVPLLSQLMDNSS